MTWKPLLSEVNVECRRESFMRDYNVATSVFNNFFGTMAMLAHNAMLEAYDMYEGSPIFRRNVKYWFGQTQASWERFWKLVDIIFEDKRNLYMDYLVQTTGAIQPDVVKLYYSVGQSLMRQKIDDTARLSWVYVSDIVVHYMLTAYRRFLEDIDRETGRELSAAFRWADPARLVSCTGELVKALYGKDVMMDDSVELGMRIIANHVMSPDWQDEAAMAAANHEEHAEFRAQMSECIAEYEEHCRQREKEEAQANEAYWEKVEAERRRRRQGRQETLTADQTAERLEGKYKIKRK